MQSQTRTYFDEMNSGPAGVRDLYANYANWLRDVPAEQLESKRQEAELLFRRVGITFNVYGEDAGTERLIPFDSVPRIIPASEWSMLERGMRQRVAALNAFLYDIYHDQNIIRAGIIPAEQVFANDQFQPCMQGLNLPGNIYAHITGVDLIRNDAGDYFVLEDNLRTPSGVSYMMENRKMMMRLFPELFSRHAIAPVSHYPALLLKTLRESSAVDNPCVVVLTPGRYNSAYFEHAFLAQQMGIELVEGQDLFVKNILGVIEASRTSCRPNPSGKKAPSTGACYAFWIILIIIIPIIAGCACIIGLIYGIYTVTCKKKSVH